MRKRLAFALIAGLRCCLSNIQAASFQDLNFESPVFIPVQSGWYPYSVDAGAALPGWTVIVPGWTNPVVLHDDVFLDSAGVSIIDAAAQNLSPPLPPNFLPLEGKYTVVLYGGYSLNYPAGGRVSASISQTAEIPPWAKSLNFDVQGLNYSVTVGGQIFTNGPPIDISAFSGQTETITFTSYPKPAPPPPAPPGTAINYVFLDAIQFLPKVAPEPGALSFLTLRSFTALNEGYPYGGVIQGVDGALYGTASGGTTRGVGSVFRLSVDGSNYTVLHAFTNPPDGSTPSSTLLQGSDGMLYGTTLGGGIGNVGTLFKIGTDGSSYTVFTSFTNSPEAVGPRGALIQGFDGALYGTTVGGGSGGYGTVFRIMPDGTAYSVLHSFTNAPDGGLPYAGLVQGVDGALYGTARTGGDFTNGTVFTITTNGQSYSVLYSFASFPGDGISPESALLQGPDGFLYGTTVYGGTSGCGTVFKLNTNGTDYSTLYSFTNYSDGANPYYRAPVMGSDGTLYGTTVYGGNPNGDGTVYALNPNSGGCAVVYSFSGIGDGAHPYGGLTANGNGVFYGTTWAGRASGFGTVYRLAFVPTLQIAANGQSAQVTLTGFPDQYCSLQGTTNFTDWLNLADLVLTNGAAQFIDSDFFPARFYRAVVP